MLLDGNFAGCIGCKATDFLLGVLYKPDVAAWIFGNTKGLTCRSWNSIFHKLVGFPTIKRSALVIVLFFVSEMPG